MNPSNLLSWSFANIWNESIAQPEKALYPRTHIWASELGGAYVDRWLKMKATPPTNPPNLRSKRKFEAGKLMEWVVALVLKRAGILRDTQTRAKYQYPALLEVTGYLDMQAGGQPDWSKVENGIYTLSLPESFLSTAHNIIAYFKKEYPQGLNEVVMEIKSCSAFMFEVYENYGIGKANHALQLFHYLKALNMKEGHLVYVCRDDLRLLEFGVYNPSPIEDRYKEDIATMTEYIKTDTQPPLEKEIVFNEESFKFNTNWKVEYSGYLTMLYGYTLPLDYQTKYKGIVNKANRVFGRCVASKKMTVLNLQIIEEIEQLFPDFQVWVKKAQSKGIKIETEETEIEET